MQRSDDIPKVVLKKDADASGKGWWWEQIDPGHELVRTGRELEQDQVARREQALIHLCLYQNQRVDSLYAAGLPGGHSRSTRSLGNKASINVVKSVVDSAVNKVAKHRPRITYLTTAGNWSSRKRAKNLRRFIDGMFHKLGVYDLMREAFHDGGIFEAGAIKLYLQDHDIRADRTLTAEIFVEENESVYGKPRTMWQRKFVHREILRRDYPDKLAEIDRANTTDAKERPRQNAARHDMIDVWEGWHLPVMVRDKKTSKKKPRGGRHVIAIDGATLYDGEWKRESFPFRFWLWNKRRVGFWGQPLAEDLTGKQLEINKIMSRIQVGLSRQATPRVWVGHGSETEAAFRSEVGSIHFYTGDKPVFETPTAFNPETYNHLKWLIESCYDETGVSQMFASAKKTAGLDAAVAIREVREESSERFVTVGQRLEQFAIEIAEGIIELAREAADQGIDLDASDEGKEFLRSVRWSQVNLDDSAFVMRPYPTSSLPDHPSGRLQTVTELFKAGLIDSKQEAMRLLEFPDLEESMSLALADLEETSRLIEVIEGGGYEPPDPMLNLQNCIEMAHAAFIRARSSRAPDDVLNRLLQFMDEARALLETPGATPPDAIQPPAPAPMPDPMGAAPMDPMAGAPMPVPPPQASPAMPIPAATGAPAPLPPG